jgi:putative GTP pyrophosphokinase
MAEPDSLTSRDGIQANGMEEITGTWSGASRFFMLYRFAIYEVTTKINILREEFGLAHDYNPIETVSSRLKSADRIVAKAKQRGYGLSVDEVRSNIRDIAGVRVTCSFKADVYTIFDMLCGQSDVTVVEVDDYIAQPKSNGYQSLHAIVRIPVFLSGGAEQVDVEIQFRTLAMDFWASLEHKIYYKYDRRVPVRLVEELKQAADAAARLDNQMERLHREVTSLESPSP